MRRFKTYDEIETRQLAQNFAAQLSGGEIIELIGDLGSGKTTFVKGVVEALGSSVLVKSPTFTIMNEYPVEDEKIARIVHLDLYRFNSPEEVAALELDDYLDEHTVIFVEWPNIFNVPIFEGAMRVEFEMIDETTREIGFV